ncbi:right-handed parallel beta-helix repeat-containing protein [Methanobrevibacter millerae]|uniref:Polymorphic outer membrane protein repeat-containing protein n=1 Tax=Methanobrevibacter millerae TaxID=230361 RepID=A0A1G5VVV7_9EURY|nr:right-handed parallel beta-helix repeat-containing protein [Methanobrevibacter millerae]SDA49145.1 polymorphic outer membrane protein repeat-containing protein [Methanobrevibacter millerae]
MDFQNRISNLFNGKKDFKYLDDLVNSGKDEVKLTSDICLSNAEESLYVEGIEIKNDVIIDGCGHMIDANEKSRIFKIENKRVTFKNINFKNGSFRSVGGDGMAFIELLAGGGAVYAFDSNLRFENCSFNNCLAHRGGAVSLSYCEASIDDCHFTKNIAKEWAGAVFDDDDSSLTVSNSTFNSNLAGKEADDIRAIESSLIVNDCNFLNAAANASIEAGTSGNAVLKDSTFNNADVVLNCLSVIKSCDFKNSQISGRFSEIYIPEGESYDFNVESDKIRYLTSDMGWVLELTEHELAREFLKYFPKFNGAEFSEQDRLHNEMIEFVDIWRKICSYDANFLMADVIVNVLDLDADDIEFDRIDKESAVDKGSFDELHGIFESVIEMHVDLGKNFKYLDDLIHSEKNIVLNSNVRLDDDEAGDYADGIKIDVDDLVLDGNNHYIDADNKASIFKIDGKNVLIKNVVFKNAFSNMGGAVSNIGEVTFENCKFMDNIASELGGAIANDEKMTIKGCEFTNNSSGGVGGAIAATYVSELLIEETKFTRNTVSSDVDCPGELLPEQAQGFGGAIYNNGKLDINNVQFVENSCDVSGGAMIILPDSKVKMDAVLFKDNHAKRDGGVVHTMGEIDIDNSEFITNHADNTAGVFDATESSKLMISNSKFEDNSASDGKIIVNKGKLDLIDSPLDEGDIVDESPSVNDDGNVLEGETEMFVIESNEESSESKFPEGYDDFARKFKDYFEEMLEEEDTKGNRLMMSLLFALWADKFPEDANLVGAALLMGSIYGDELVRVILEDFTQEEYRRRLTQYDPIDEELSSWFMAVALVGMIFANSKDDEDEEKLTSDEYAQHYIDFTNNFANADEEKDDVYDSIKDLVNEWRQNFPGDLNMSLAYITVNFPHLSEEKIIELLEGLKEQSPGDDDSYEKLYADCKCVLSLRNINLDDYLED